MRHKKAVGERLTLPTAGGPVEFDVLSIYYDYTSERGFAVMDRATFVRHFGEAAPGEPDRVSARRRRRGSRAGGTAGGRSGGASRSSSIPTRRCRHEVLRIFDSTFAITYALEAIAIFVAILGVAGTLLTLVLERRRELTHAAARGRGAAADAEPIVMIEAGVIGGVSQALGMSVGLGLSLILIYVINVQSFGWTIQFHLPVGFLVQSSVLVLAATICPGCTGAHRGTPRDHRSGGGGMRLRWAG